MPELPHGEASPIEAAEKISGARMKPSQCGGNRLPIYNPLPYLRA
jgi:hypothetical protein